MKNINDIIQQRINQTVDKVQDTIRQKAADIVEEKAIQYYRRSFQTKSWDGESWAPAKKTPKRGHLMYRTGALMGSIGRHINTPTRVVIRGGNQKAPYARIHNEGGTINNPGSTRQNTWKVYKRGKFAGRTLFAKNTVNATFSQKNIIKPYTINIPKRKFMGKTKELNNIIREALIAELKV